MELVEVILVQEVGESLSITRGLLKKCMGLNS
jgi:hypothetical protein